MSFSFALVTEVRHIFTGRNEVLAKVIFLHLSVILSTGGGGLPQCMLGCPPPPAGRAPPGRQTPPGYGHWSAGTHPTGMHSCIIMYFALVSSPEKVTVEWVCCKMSGRVEYHAGWGGGLNDIMCLTCTAHAPGSSGTMTCSQTVFSCDGYLCHHGKHCTIRTLFARTEELTKTTAQDQVSSQSSDTAIYRTYLWYLSCKTAAHI